MITRPAPLLAAACLALAPAAVWADLGGCKLGDLAARQGTADCLGCHAGHDAHPVDLDYAVRAAYRQNDLRPAAEVVARGLFLPDGYMRCQTCHDARSPWKHRIALPPGAAARPAVSPRMPASYAGSRGLAPAVQPGEAVTPTPLCRACHTIGD